MIMIEGKDYLLVEDDLHSDQFLIKLTSGVYAGIVYRYGKVSIVEEKNRARLKFIYKICSAPDSFGDHSNITTNADFNNHIGEVLADIISNNEYKIGSRD